MRHVARASGQLEVEALTRESALKRCYLPWTHNDQWIDRAYGVCEKCYCLQSFMAGEICHMIIGHWGAHNEDGEAGASANADALRDLVESTAREQPGSMPCPIDGEPMNLQEVDGEELLVCTANGDVTDPDNEHIWPISEYIWEVVDV